MTIKELFLLDPDITFLNHGSFGACPRPVFEVYQDWQRRLEYQPVQFLTKSLPELLHEARSSLGRYLNAPADELVFIPNATYGVNVIARSLDLQPGDEILASNHEYGACDRTWQYICQKTGGVYRRQAVDLPATSQSDIVEQIWSGVTDRTRLLFISHITSPTALTIPAAELCALAREAGILTLVDGAHAPGQIPVDLGTIGADFYTGNCHKWMLAPKGAGFLYARPEVQHLVEPLVVSWGWQAEETFTTGSQFVDYFQWRGTDDPAACLTVPAAIQFMQENGWESVHQQCRSLLSQALVRVSELTSLPGLYPAGGGSIHQMGATELPRHPDLKAFKVRLYDEYQVEVPFVEWEGRHFLRISVQAYNDEGDIDRLIQALGALLRLD